MLPILSSALAGTFIASTSLSILGMTIICIAGLCRCLEDNDDDDNHDDHDDHGNAYVETDESCIEGTPPPAYNVKQT